jgi:hypothetical protein
MSDKETILQNFKNACEEHPELTNLKKMKNEKEKKLIPCCEKKIEFIFLCQSEFSNADMNHIYKTTLFKSRKMGTKCLFYTCNSYGTDLILDDGTRGFCMSCNYQFFE